jgi:hypothetical protein
VRDLEAQLRNAGRPADDLQIVLEAMQRLAQEGAYDDPIQVAQLQAEALDALKRLEFGLRRDVEGEAPQRARLTGSDDVPEGYRALVEEYYRTLARGAAIERTSAVRTVEDLSHLVTKARDGERLGDVVHLRDPNALEEHLVFGVSRHEEERRGRVQVTETLTELAAAEPGHDDVGQQEVDAAVVLGRDPERLLTTERLEDLVPVTPQHLARDP